MKIIFVRVNYCAFRLFSWLERERLLRLKELGVFPREAGWPSMASWHGRGSFRLDCRDAGIGPPKRGPRERDSLRGARRGLGRRLSGQQSMASFRPAGLVRQNSREGWRLPYLLGKDIV
jgi:hypothetical protein